MLMLFLQGAGETLRGTLNSTVEKHFGANPQAIEANQAAIDAGRYEMDNRRFYHPNDYRQQQENPVHTNGTGAAQLHDAPYDDPSWSMSSGLAGPDRGRQSRRSKLGSLFTKGIGHSSSQVDSDNPFPAPEPERAKLRKRSSSRLSGSKLGIVRE
jgi:hypothetical protein